MTDFPNFIAGAQRPPVGGAWLEVHEPATGEPYARAAASGADDVEVAVAAAQEAFPSWSRQEADERGRVLHALADALEDDAESLAELESKDTGKPISLARRVDIPRAIANLRFFAGAAVHFASEAHSTGTHAVNFTLRQPLGAVACISPWNLPLYLLTWKIAPALAAGNTVVAKPSELTPATATRLALASRRAGLPAGVLNIVHGRGPEAGAALTDHPDIRAISFTGSTATGAAIASSAAPRFVRTSLEMGGKNATIVFADADLDHAADAAVRAAFSNQGQICLCGSRILIERSAYDALRERLLARTRALRVGDPVDESTDLGALVSAEHLQKVERCVRVGIEEGAAVLAGGHPVNPGGRCAQGWFHEPTLLEGLESACRTNQEEIFGPVASLIPFEDEEEALAIANDSRYGLACSLFTRDLARAHRIARGIEAGIVWINCWMLRDLRTPFGGMKQSGLGREGGWEAMRFFTEMKNVCIQHGS